MISRAQQKPLIKKKTTRENFVANAARAKYKGKVGTDAWYYKKKNAFLQFTKIRGLEMEWKKKMKSWRQNNSWNRSFHIVDKRQRLQNVRKLKTFEQNDKDKLNKLGAHQMELPSPSISWVNPFPSRVINRTIFFCNVLESHEYDCCLMSLFWLALCSISARNLLREPFYL